MSKGGTVAGTVSERAFRSRDAAGMRAAGLDALLITERNAAWLPTAPPQPSRTGFDDPAVWDDQGGTRWTPDLVHCRLVEAGSILKRLPAPAGPSDHVSVWRKLAPARRVVAPPTSFQITICEWTVEQLMRLTITDRVIAFGFALSISARLIADHMAAGHVGATRRLRKTQICDRYKIIQADLATQWNALGAVIDSNTYERWQERMKAIKNRTRQTGQI